MDSLIKDAVKEGTTIDGADGLRNELTKAVLERALNSELTHIFGYEAVRQGLARVFSRTARRRKR
ncbi:hypothetical protein BST47_14180 [Mycolicibacterium tusciae]|uniref:Transposase n=1 Tax=Mycolicibacterium tusciae TaxID=75922 RepID=A0A1X0JQQ0_9MYCO|nr:hypothetical protein BST47_14180 [Mycolicibacterium tusciae]